MMVVQNYFSHKVRPCPVTPPMSSVGKRAHSTGIIRSRAFHAPPFRASIFGLFGTTLVYKLHKTQIFL